MDKGGVTEPRRRAVKSQVDAIACHPALDGAFAHHASGSRHPPCCGHCAHWERRRTAARSVHLDEERVVPTFPMTTRSCQVAD